MEASGEVEKNRISVEALGKQAGGFVAPYSPSEFSDKTVAPCLILRALYPADLGYQGFPGTHLLGSSTPLEVRSKNKKVGRAT